MAEVQPLRLEHFGSTYATLPSRGTADPNGWLSLESSAPPPCHAPVLSFPLLEGLEAKHSFSQCHCHLGMAWCAVLANRRLRELCQERRGDPGKWHSPTGGECGGVARQASLLVHSWRSERTGSSISTGQGRASYGEPKKGGQNTTQLPLAW